MPQEVLGGVSTNATLVVQERAGVKMILIQDGSQNTNVDKPLRIIGDPYKVQVGAPGPRGWFWGAERGQRIGWRFGCKWRDFLEHWL